MGNEKLLVPGDDIQRMLNDDARFQTSFEFRAAEMIIRALLPMLQSIQNAQDLLLQVESGFLKRKDMKERFEQFYQKVADQMMEQAKANGQTVEVTPESVAAADTEVSDTE